LFVSRLEFTGDSLALLFAELFGHYRPTKVARRYTPLRMYLSRTTHGDSIRTFNAGRFLLYQSTYAPGTSLPRHYHEDSALMFATRGRFSENVAGRTFDCTAFDVIARPGGEAHTNRYDGGPTSCIVANFPNDLARFFSAPSMLPRIAVAPIANRVARELEVADEVSPLVVEGLLLELIGTASRPATCKFAPSWLGAARDFIHEHAAEKVTLQEIAAAARVHPASVVRAF